VLLSDRIAFQGASCRNLADNRPVQRLREDCSLNAGLNPSSQSGSLEEMDLCVSHLL
jgi:hypothetical protein